MKVETTSERLLFNTCYIEAHAGGEMNQGTGFFYSVPAANDSIVHFIVTNRHVTRDAEKLSFRLFRKDKDGDPQLGKTVTVNLVSVDFDPIQYPENSSYDVAVVPLLPLLSHAGLSPEDVYFRSISPDICVGPGGNPWMNAIEDVTMVGYPNGLFDTHNFTPIVRRGVTATPPRLEYQNTPTFLIDAAVYPGSSGSPVFLHSEGFVQDKPGNYRSGERFWCLGILAAGHTQQVFGSVGDLPAEEIFTHFEAPINLGIVYKSNIWHECCIELMRKNGIEPAEIKRDRES